MSGILDTILIIGAMGVGLYLVIHRCDILQLCGAAGGNATLAAQIAAAAAPVSGPPPPPPPPPDVITVAQPAPSSLSDGGCQCNLDRGVIVCSGDGGKTFHHTNSPDLKSAIANCKRKLINPTTSSSKAVVPDTSVVCTPGSHLSASGVCVRDNVNPKSRAANPKPNRVFAGCKSGEVQRCSTNGNCVCIGHVKVAPKAQQHPKPVKSPVTKKPVLDECGCRSNQISQRRIDGSCFGGCI